MPVRKGPHALSPQGQKTGGTEVSTILKGVMVEEADFRCVCLLYLLKTNKCIEPAVARHCAGREKKTVDKAGKVPVPWSFLRAQTATSLPQGRTGPSCKPEGGSRAWSLGAPPTGRSGLAHSPPARAAPIPPLWRQPRRLRGPQMRGHAGRPAVNHTQAKLGAAGAAAAAAAMGPQREICG